MRVWIVNPFDNLPVEGNRPQRYWLMARAFARAGHDVTLWTSDFSHYRKQKRDVGGRGSDFLEDGFRVVLVSTPPYRRHVGLRRILSHCVLARNWARRVMDEPQPDLIVVSSPPLSLCAAVRRRCAERRIPYVVDVQDAWPETFERVLPRFALAPLRRITRKNYAGAAAASVVAERYADLVKGYGVVAPVRLFPLAMELPEEDDGKGGGRMDGVRGQLRLVYAGNMGRSYDLATLADAVERLDGVVLDVAGAGPAEDELRRRAAACPRIRVHGYLGERELRELLASSDVGVVPMFEDSCVGVPGKLADYAAAGLPVLNSLAGETERLIAEARAGFTYRAGDCDSLCHAVETIRSADFAALRAGAAALAKRFDARIVYGEYVKWAAGLVESARKGSR